MDINLMVVSGRVAAAPTLTEFETGETLVKLLVATRITTPRRRVDVLPVTFYSQFFTPDDIETVASLSHGQGIYLTGMVQRRFFGTEAGRRSQLEIVAHAFSVTNDEEGK